MKLTWKSAGIGIGVLFLLVAAQIFIGTAPIAEHSRLETISSVPPGRVVFITLDGVREQDVFTIWERLQNRIRRDGYFYGLRADGEGMWVSNSAVRSLAGYRAIFTGKYERFCWRNDCSLIESATLIDALLDRGTPAEDVGVFASWTNIGLAVESKPRSIRSVGLEAIQNVPLSLVALKKKMTNYETDSAHSLPPWSEVRSDRFTWMMALEYERSHHPRFLYISLVDSDEYGHENDFSSYQQSLRRYEADILALIDEIEAGPRGEMVSFVITTDHGRGDKNFKSHGWWIPTSDRIWAAVLPSKALRKHGVHKREGRIFRQVDLRPTLEYLMGEPLQSDRQGDPLVLNGESRS